MEYRIIETTDGKYIPQVNRCGMWNGIDKPFFHACYLWSDEKSMNQFCKVIFKRSALSAIKAHKKESKLEIKRIIEVE